MRGRTGLFASSSSVLISEDSLGATDRHFVAEMASFVYSAKNFMKAAFNLIRLLKQKLR